MITKHKKEPKINKNISSKIEKSRKSRRDGKVFQFEKEKASFGFILDKNTRTETFKRRAPGVISKCNQLTEITGCDIALTIFNNETQSVIYYISDPMIYANSSRGLLEGCNLTYDAPNRENYSDEEIKRNMIFFLSEIGKIVQIKSTNKPYFKVISSEFPLSPSLKNSIEFEPLKKIFK
jgi:hypothetical protein